MRRQQRWVLTVAFVLTVSPSSRGSETALPQVREQVGFDQNIGTTLPLDLAFTDSSGANVTLADVFQNRPAVLAFGYFTCPQLCGVTLNGTLDALRQLQPTIGQDYDLVYVSIDRSDTAIAAREKLAQELRLYGRGETAAGWHFLTGDQKAIAALTEAAGFRFERVTGTDLFAHPSGFLVVRPDGVIVRYFLGVDFRPAEIAAALRDAEAGRTGHPVFDLLLVCFSGGLQAGAARWAFVSVQIAAALSVLGLVTGIGRLLWIERRSARKEPTP